MSHQFRELLKKVGSGQHTKKDLTRTEAALAAGMMLTQEATPAQIGAFLIAHRIKRPTGIELAGMLDAYDEFSLKLQPLPPSSHPVLVFGIPYDGRSRTAPLTPVTALLLAAAGASVILHGGDTMPTKYGIPLAEIWRGLGLEFAQLSAARVQASLEQTGFTFVYTPDHFPLAAALVPYRDQIGKRPPLATLELMWSPYAGPHHLIAGYVHPPTEAMMKVAFAERGQTDYTLVKGLEGSCDLRLSQTTIAVASQPQSEAGFEYLKLNPHDYGFAGKDVPLASNPELFAQLEAVLAGQPSDLFGAIVWNSGFYLWRCGICADLAAGLERAKELLLAGDVAKKRDEVRATLLDSQSRR